MVIAMSIPIKVGHICRVIMNMLCCFLTPLYVANLVIIVTIINRVTIIVFTAMLVSVDGVAIRHFATAVRRSAGIAAAIVLFMR